MPDIIFEIMSEEIPARMQVRALSELKELVLEKLKSKNLLHQEVDSFITPRRLALIIRGIPVKQPNTKEGSIKVC